MLLQMLNVCKSVILLMWPASAGSMIQGMAAREFLEHRRNGCHPVWNLVQVLRALPAHPGTRHKWGQSPGSCSRSSRDHSRTKRDDLGCPPHVRYRCDRGMSHHPEEPAHRQLRGAWAGV